MRTGKPGNPFALPAILPLIESPYEESVSCESISQNQRGPTRYANEHGCTVANWLVNRNMENVFSWLGDGLDRRLVVLLEPAFCSVR